MVGNINNIAVIGTGVIGSGWIIRILAHNKKVVAFDKDIKQEKRLIKEIKRTWPYVKKLFNKKKLNLNKLQFLNSLEETVKTADFIKSALIVTSIWSPDTGLSNMICIILLSPSLPNTIFPGLLF